MQKVFWPLILTLFISPFTLATETHRTAILKNNEVAIWETMIYPDKNQNLAPHRHDHNRVLVAFTKGALKIVNNKGHVSYISLQKNKAYFVKHDAPKETHTDENISGHPIDVLVIELLK
jgi:hypothetical protein